MSCDQAVTWEKNIIVKISKPFKTAVHDVQTAKDQLAQVKLPLCTMNLSCALPAPFR